MPKAVACEGCGATIIQENHSPISVKHPNKPIPEIIGYVHKAPESAPINVIPNCHRLAFQHLKDKHAEILIEKRTLNSTTVRERAPKPKLAESSSSAVEHAQRRNNVPSHTLHSPYRPH